MSLSTKVSSTKQSYCSSRNLVYYGGVGAYCATVLAAGYYLGLIKTGWDVLAYTGASGVIYNIWERIYDSRLFKGACYWTKQIYKNGFLQPEDRVPSKISAQLELGAAIAKETADTTEKQLNKERKVEGSLTEAWRNGGNDQSAVAERVILNHRKLIRRARSGLAKQHEETQTQSKAVELAKQLHQEKIGRGEESPLYNLQNKISEQVNNNQITRAIANQVIKILREKYNYTKLQEI